MRSLDRFASEYHTLDEKEDSTAHTRDVCVCEPSSLPSRPTIDDIHLYIYIYIYISKRFCVSLCVKTVTKPSNPIRVKTHNENALYATALLSKRLLSKRRANHHSLVAKNYAQYVVDDDIENDDAKKR